MAIVKCDICGGTYSDRHLKSHQRLAHPPSGKPGAILDEEAITQQISILFEQLPKKLQKELIARLSAGGVRITPC